MSTCVSIHPSQVGTFFDKRFALASYFCVHITVYFFLCRLKTNYIVGVCSWPQTEPLMRQHDFLKMSVPEENASVVTEHNGWIAEPM